ncbi:MAG: hypothetical protein GKR89_13045 [Candidatus Latescibacteria bacterium]|nr:hypothetical protein [Candidatus Latescibacterota bacterium]
MLEDPYRFVEAVKNRREYLADQLQQASPVVGLPYAEGLLLLTTTPGPRKLFEIYNQVAFAAVGHPADMEKLRKAVIDLAHLDAFNLSPQDVSLQRMVSQGLGPLMKDAFDEIFRSPFIARALLAELDPPTGQECFYTVDADGSFGSSRTCAAVSGTPQSQTAILQYLENNDTAALPLEPALERALKAWGMGRIALDREEGTPPDEPALKDYLAQTLPGMRLEAAVLDRGRPTKSKFCLLDAPVLDQALAPYSSGESQ